MLLLLKFIITAHANNAALFQLTVAVNVAVGEPSALHKKHADAKQQHGYQQHYDCYQHNFHSGRYLNFVQIYERFMRFYRLFQNIFVT